MTNRTLTGLLWTSLATGANVLSLLLVVVVLARLLTPADFGLAAAALVVIGFSAIFSDFGVGPAVVQRKELRTAHESTGFTLSVVLGVALAILIWFAAPLIASFFQLDALVPLLRTLAILFPVQGLGIVADSLLQRELRFRTLAILDVITFVIGYGFFGITLAFFGFAAWSLVIAHLAQTSLRAILLVGLRPHPIWPAFEWRACADLFNFGIGFTAGRFSNYLAGQAEHLIIGGWLGPAALGIYGRAYQLMAGPAVLLGNVLDRVLFPTMVYVQHQPKRLAQSYRRNVALVALLILPVSVMVATLAPEIVRILLGDAWDAVIVPLQILSAGMLFRCSCKISDSLVRATGAVYGRTWRQTVYAFTVLVGAWFGQHWGVEGVATAVLVTLVLNFVLMAHLALSLAHMSWRSFLAAHVPGLRLAALIGLPVVIVDDWVRELGMRPPWVVALSLVTATPFLVAAYLMPRFFVGRDGHWLARQLTAMLRDILAQSWKRPAPAPVVAAGVGDLGMPIRLLVECLNRAGVRYCAWKACVDLNRVLSGRGDLDLLVDPRDGLKFLKVAESLDFHRAAPPIDVGATDEVHVYGLDAASGVLLHIHVNFTLVNACNGLVPTVEEMALQSCARAGADGVLGAMPVVTPGFEIVVRVLRAMEDHASLFKLPRLLTGQNRLRTQLHALLEVDVQEAWRTLVNTWMPPDAREAFVEALAAFCQRGGWYRRGRCSRLLQSALGQQPRLVGFFAQFATCVRDVYQAGLRRVTRRAPSYKALAGGGRIIAFVGPDASGKSTMVLEAASFLGSIVPVQVAHLGKPPSTWLTWLPNALGRFLGRVAPALRTFHQRPLTAAVGATVHADVDSPAPRAGLLYRIRAVLLAWDRRALARRLASKAACGWVIVCDRYPTACVGAPDSARLPVSSTEENLSPLGACLARIEHRLYRDIPEPDVVICLSTPLDVAVDRNRRRDKAGKEGDDFVARRHGDFFLPSFGAAQVIRLDTDLSRQETIRSMRRHVWTGLKVRSEPWNEEAPHLRILTQAPLNRELSNSNHPLVVEFIGVTGVGKSTLMHAVVQDLMAKGLRVRLAEDAILANFGLACVSDPKLGSALISTLSFVPFARLFLTRNGSRLTRLAWQSILRGMGSWRMGLNLMRNFVKRIGAELLLEDLSRQLRDVDILIWDEGSVHAAHNLFVHPDTAPVLEEIVTFAALVPKPDCLIWVTAPTAQSTRVLTRRGHRRVGTNVDSAQAFAEHASTTFQALAEVPELKKRIYCISNLALGDVPSEEVLHARAQEVGAYLLRALRAMRDPPQPEGVARCLIA